MYKKILIPLDGSKRAEMIRPHVRELASRFQATVILIFYGSVAAGILNQVDRPLFIIRSRWAE